MAKWVVRDRRRRAHPGDPRARLHGGDQRAARAGRARAAGGRAGGAGRRRGRTALPGRAAAPRPGEALERAARAAGGRRAAVRARRRRAVGRGGVPRRSRAGRSRLRAAGGAPRSAARTSSTTAARVYAGDVGIGVNPALAQRDPRLPTCCSRSARGWRRSRRRATRCSRRRPRRSRSCTCTRTRPSSAASTSPRSAIVSGAGRVRRRRARARVVGARWADWTAAARADYEAWIEHADGAGRRRRHGRGAWRTCATRLADDAIVTNGAGNFTVWVASLLRSSRALSAPQLGADERRDGLRRARRRSAAKLVHPERDGGRVRGRRRLPDERPGARDRGAGRPADPRDRRQQRHATGRSACTRSGTTPAACIGHRPRQPRLRRPRPRLRRPRRAGRAGPPSSRPRWSARARGRAGADRARSCDPEALTPRRR